jgi:hypothetical protein
MPTRNKAARVHTTPPLASSVVSLCVIGCLSQRTHTLACLLAALVCSQRTGAAPVAPREWRRAPPAAAAAPPPYGRPGASAPCFAPPARGPVGPPHPSPTAACGGVRAPIGNRQKQTTKHVQIRTNVHTHQTHGLTDTQTDRQADKTDNRQTERQTDRQRQRDRDRETERINMMRLQEAKVVSLQPLRHLSVRVRRSWCT